MDALAQISPGQFSPVAVSLSPSARQFQFSPTLALSPEDAAIENENLDAEEANLQELFFEEDSGRIRDPEAGGDRQVIKIQDPLYEERMGYRPGNLHEFTQVDGGKEGCFSFALRESRIAKTPEELARISQLIQEIASSVIGEPTDDVT